MNFALKFTTITTTETFLLSDIHILDTKNQRSPKGGLLGVCVLQ